MKIILIKSTLIALFVFASLISSAQVMAPSDPSTEPQGEPLGGGAPLSNGLYILLGLAALYGGNKIYYLSLKKPEEQKPV
jgi:hypothetical protein